MPTSSEHLLYRQREGHVEVAPTNLYVELYICIVVITHAHSMAMICTVHVASAHVLLSCELAMQAVLKNATPLNSTPV